jgi:hypothetical protein
MKIYTILLILFIVFSLSYCQKRYNEIYSHQVFQVIDVGRIILSPHFTTEEINTITLAARRNNCERQDLFLLFAVAKAENGPPGTELGVMHPRAKNTNLDIQAGWAAATIMKNKHRYYIAGAPNFFVFLAQRYCPKEVDPVGHKNWIKNVYHWYWRFYSEYDSYLKQGYVQIPVTV